MNLYRFESGKVGVYEAVERDCPRSDLRRSHKPDGSWLPRVGEKFPGAISFWTEYGLEKYLHSGLQEWHRSVLSEPLKVLTANFSGNPIYHDDFQIICRPEQIQSLTVSWENFCLSLRKYPTVQKAQAYIVKGEGKNAKLLVFEHDEQWSEAGIQVPAGTIDPGEAPEEAVIRETEEECGLHDLKIARKVDHYMHFRHIRKEFNDRHVFLMETQDSRDAWVHKVAGQGKDQGMNFHYYWMPIQEAAYRLADTQGCSIHRICR
jgi:ADP-ribose pyrophosphatase YjhB (NUDIX family)